MPKKYLYTSQVNGTTVALRQRVIETDDVLVFISEESGVPIDEIIDDSIDDTITINEYGVFLTSSECVESYVLIG